MSDFDGRGRRIVPSNWRELALAGYARCAALIGGDSSDFAAMEPDDPKVMVAEAGSGNAVLPSLLVASKLAVGGGSHDPYDSLFVVPAVD